MGVALAAAVVAVVLQLPWSLSAVSVGWRGVVGLSTTGSEPLSLSAVLRFATGPFGSTPLGWVFLPAGLLVLLIGKSWRLRLGGAGLDGGDRVHGGRVRRARA